MSTNYNEITEKENAHTTNRQACELQRQNSVGELLTEYKEIMEIISEQKHDMARKILKLIPDKLHGIPVDQDREIGPFTREGEKIAEIRPEEGELIMVVYGLKANENWEIKSIFSDPEKVGPADKEAEDIVLEALRIEGYEASCNNEEITVYMPVSNKK